MFYFTGHRERAVLQRVMEVVLYHTAGGEAGRTKEMKGSRLWSNHVTVGGTYNRKSAGRLAVGEGGRIRLAYPLAPCG